MQTFFYMVILIFTFELMAEDKEYVVFNEKTKLFEIKKEITTEEKESTFTNLENFIKSKIPQEQRLKSFSQEKGFLDDLHYLKQKKKSEGLTALEVEMLKQWSWSLKTVKGRLDEKNLSLTPETISDEMKKQLILQAQRARVSAYAPYSKFYVGAALLTKSGKIYTGCNWENAAFGNTICAERTAIGNAVTAENRSISFQKNEEIVAVAVVIRGGQGSPCGTCRQSLYEFNPNMLILMADIDGSDVEQMYLNSMLPLGFGPGNLKKGQVK